MDDLEPKAEVWSCPPESDLRHIKTQVEQEMMIKLGAQKETIEFHPLILAQRAPRANTSFQLDYQRVKPPYKEKQPPNRDPWVNDNHALRQLGSTRQGPRKLLLPTVPHTKAVKRVSIPASDEHFRKLRILRLQKRDEILSEWSALQYQAFEVKRLSHFSLPDIDPLRRFSVTSLHSPKSPTPPEKIAFLSGGGRKAKPPAVVPFTNVPPTGKPRSRWRGMARQLLWNNKGAQMLLPEELPKSEVRIYISSTEDLTEEREFLAEVAHAELRKFCEKQGLSCHVVDLRHGTSRLKNDKETHDVIRREIAMCQKYSIGPCFVSLVGRDADDSELPGWLTKDHMLAVRSILVKAGNDKAVETLDNLYRLDSNYQPPIYLLEESYFFADTEETDILHHALPEVFAQLRQEGVFAQDEPGFYSWSSTVKEIETGLLSCVEPKRQAVCLMARAESDIDGKEASGNTKVNGDKKASDAKRTVSAASRTSSIPSEFLTPTDSDSADKLRRDIVNLYNRLGSKNNLILFNVAKKKTLTYLREVCSLFLSAVTRVIEAQLTHHEFDISHHLTSAADIIQHVAVARRSCSDLLGVESVMNGIPEMLMNVGRVKVVVVVGNEGAGKTALTSLIAIAVPRIDPLRKVVFRIVGLTLSSSSLLHLVTSLYHQVCFLYDRDPFLPADISLKGTLQAFKEMLFDIRENNPKKGPLTIVLDGLEKLHDMDPKHLLSLVGSMPQGITVVVSLPESGPLYEAARGLEGVEFVGCPAFTSQLSGAFIKEYLSKHDKVITSDQIRAILNELHSDNVPLVAKIAASMASHWPSHTLQDNLDISSDMESAFHRLMESCEVQLGHSFTKFVMSLLVASRFGLAEFEIVHIISTDSDIIDEIQEEAEDMSILEGYPFQMQLSRLLARIEPFLSAVKTEGETVLKINHEMLRYVIQVRFLSDDFKHRIHSGLATYFQFTRRGNLLSSRDIVEGKHKELSHYLWRTLRSVPYHLCHSHADAEKAWTAVKREVFMKFSWIINEIYAGFFNDFIDDMNYALDTLGLDSEVMFLRQFLIGVRQTVIFNPVSLAALLAGQDLKEMAMVQSSVRDAQVWLKQVHLQVLVPATYTVAKASQLQLHASLATAVTSLVTDSTGERVVVQHQTHLSSLDHATGEETTVVRQPHLIVSTYLWGTAMITILAKSSSKGEVSLETYAVDKGRLVKSTPLKGSDPIKWLHVRQEGVAYYATTFDVKKVQLTSGQVSEQFSTDEEIIEVAMADNRYRIVTLHSTPKALLHVFDVRESTAPSATVNLSKTLEENCKRLALTKDSQYAVVVCHREVVVVDINANRMMYARDFNNLPVTMTAFSRSHEHVFVVTPTGLIRCYKIMSGVQTMQATLRTAKQNPPPKKRAASTLLRGGRGSSESPGRDRTPSPLVLERKRNEQTANQDELVTTLLTSEDDHFLMAGTVLGNIHIFHVPTGLEVGVVCGGQSGLKEMFYFTNLSWFQSIVTVDAAGVVKLWNLRPLLSRARTLIMNIINDKDLLNEEKFKMDLGPYFSRFQGLRNDRVFLNGPDISSFYQRPPPPDLFSSIKGLDPALQASDSWMVTGCIADCSHICALSAGTDLSEVLVTATRYGDLARWSLKDGSLLCLQASPCPVEDQANVQSVRSVFYDQAVCLVIREGNGRHTVTVRHVEDKRKRPLVVKDTIATHIGCNGTEMMQVYFEEGAELSVMRWSLVNHHQLNRTVLSNDVAFAKLASNLIFSEDLSACALLIPNKNERCTLYVWTLKTSTNADEVPEVNDREVDEATSDNVSPRSEAMQSSQISHSKKQTEDVHRRELHLLFMPTAIGFALSDAILLGTSTGVPLMVALKTLKLTSAFTANGVEHLDSPSDESESTTALWEHLPRAHTSGIKELTNISGSHVITSISDDTLCLWNLLSKRLLLQIKLEGQQFVHHVLSRDSRVLAYVTSNSILAVWGVNKGKQLCSIMLQFTATAFVMTPDNRRVALLQDDGVTSRVHVFNVKNIDDIKVDENNDKQTKEGVETVD